jgi:uncharacterized protein
MQSQLNLIKICLIYLTESFNSMKPDLIIMKIYLIAFTLFFLSCSSKSPTGNENEGYSEEDVTFQSTNLTLEGTLYIADGKGKLPGLVIVNGSGPVDRDGYFKNMPDTIPLIYKLWADFFSTNGINTLRYDKRFITYPDINPLDLSQEDQINDVVAALSYLKSRPEIDTTRIFIIGHSEGGNIAPVAAERVSFVSGVFIISATAFAVDTLFCEQLRANTSVSQDLITQTEYAFRLLRNNQFPACGQIWGAGEAYWREWIEYSENAGNIVLNLDKPVFIQQGLNDENFPSFCLQKNISLWENIAAQSSDVSFNTYINVSHLILNKDTQEIDLDVFMDILTRINGK